jgi:phage shock protein PspC (stress-responsive transcriptional regulator)
VFQIEEEAYVYLNRVLAQQTKRDESEVANLLEQKLTDHKTVITYPDVADVLYTLDLHGYARQTFQPRRLYRRTDEKVIAGVCSGLGEHFDIDPVLIRVLFVVALLLGSIGFWIYLACWIITPKH